MGFSIIIVDIGIVHYRIKHVENKLEAIWYSSRSDVKEIEKGIAKGTHQKLFR